jgi:hypothetical protein
MVCGEGGYRKWEMMRGFIRECVGYGELSLENDGRNG